MLKGLEEKSYQIRRKLFTLIGAKFHVFDSHGNLVLFTNMKGFKLKGDIRIFTGEDMQTEVLSIQARRILDFYSAYDVFDSTLHEKVGALKRKGWKSLLKDEWIILDSQDQEIGLIQEDSWLLALVRRNICNLIPQTFTGKMGDQTVCMFRQNFNPFVTKINVDFVSSDSTSLDPRLGLAAGILLCAIEGKQD